MSAASARDITRQGNDAMTTPGASGGPSTAARLVGIGLLAAAVTATLYAVGRLHAPNYTVSLFGQAGLAAVHCVLAYGVQLTRARVAVHSLAGCLFYGAFTAKVLLVRTRRLPGWALPAAGGALVLLVAVLWYTSALWYYNGYQLPGA
jgi:Family of unknown function (DUF6529)